MRLELGGGTLVTRGWTNVDKTHGEGPWKRELQDLPWPTADNSIDAARASHVMEHIPAGQVRIDIFNEVHRVLRAGATFEVIVPVVMGPGMTGPTWHAWSDPTHVSFWWMPESFHYFDGLFAANADYGIKLWKTLETTMLERGVGRWVGTPR